MGTCSVSTPRAVFLIGILHTLAPLSLALPSCIADTCVFYGTYLWLRHLCNLAGVWPDHYKRSLPTRRRLLRKSHGFNRHGKQTPTGSTSILVTTVNEVCGQIFTIRVKQEKFDAAFVLFRNSFSVCCVHITVRSYRYVFYPLISKCQKNVVTHLYVTVQLNIIHFHIL